MEFGIKYLQLLAQTRMIGSRMEDEEEDPPLAVEIKQEESISQRDDQAEVKASVGVTVITGYLGAGKSTVSLSPLHLCAYANELFALS